VAALPDGERRDGCSSAAQRALLPPAIIAFIYGVGPARGVLGGEYEKIQAIVPVELVVPQARARPSTRLLNVYVEHAVCLVSSSPPPPPPPPPHHVSTCHHYEEVTDSEVETMLE